MINNIQELKKLYDEYVEEAESIQFDIDEISSKVDEVESEWLYLFIDGTIASIEKNSKLHKLNEKADKLYEQKKVLQIALKDLRDDYFDLGLEDEHIEFFKKYKTAANHIALLMSEYEVRIMWENKLNDELYALIGDRSIYFDVDIDTYTSDHLPDLESFEFAGDIYYSI